MTTITLSLDDSTVARLEGIGLNGRGSAQSNEILGMELCDAYFQAKLDAANKAKADAKRDDSLTPRIEAREFFEA